MAQAAFESVTLDTPLRALEQFPLVLDEIASEIFSCVGDIAAQAGFRRPEIDRMKAAPDPGEAFLRHYSQREPAPTMRDLVRVMQEAEVGGIFQRMFPEMWKQHVAEEQNRQAEHKVFRAAVKCSLPSTQSRSPHPLTERDLLTAAEPFMDTPMGDIPDTIATSWMCAMTLCLRDVAAAVGMDAGCTDAMTSDIATAPATLKIWCEIKKITPRTIIEKMASTHPVIRAVFLGYTKMWLAAQ